MNRLLSQSLGLPRLTVVGLIALYQKTLSPDHGWFRGFFPYGFCPGHPTCSAYAREVIATQGVLRGLPKAAIRVLGCHPWKRPSDARLARLAEKQVSG